MALSLYDATVLGFIQTVGGVAGFMERGLSHCTDNGIDPNEIVEARLFPDMLPFRFQILSTVAHSIGAVEACKKGLMTPPGAPPELDYPALQKAVADALAALKALNPDEVNALEGRDMIFALGDFKLPFTAEGYLFSFATPNLHFHATTAYDILRTKGVPLGKRDYLGQLRLKM
jgi:hypothetical protein